MNFTCERSKCSKVVLALKIERSRERERERDREGEEGDKDSGRANYTEQSERNAS